MGPGLGMGNRARLRRLQVGVPARELSDDLLKARSPYGRSLWAEFEVGPNQHAGIIEYIRIFYAFSRLKVFFWVAK